MPYHIQCQGCGTSAYVDCGGCPPEVFDVMGGHLPLCSMADAGANVSCPPGSGCCDGSDHPELSHDQQARQCEADHAAAGHACGHREPGDCRVYHGTIPERGPCSAALHGKEIGDCTHDECPGGHHGLGVEQCTVCRPVTIIAMPGSATIHAVTGG